MPHPAEDDIATYNAETIEARRLSERSEAIITRAHEILISRNVSVREAFDLAAIFAFAEHAVLELQPSDRLLLSVSEGHVNLVTIEPTSSKKEP